MTKATKITRGTTIDVSGFISVFMLQMDSIFFNVESIHVFTPKNLAVCSSTSHPFGFTSRSKRPPLEILKFLITTLRNQDKKVAFIRVDEEGELARYFEFMKIFNDMNIIVQTKGGDAYSLNGKIKIPNKTPANITRDLLLSSIHKKELWCFSYHHAIWISL